VGMKQILLMIAVVALVGCGKKDSPESQAMPKAEPEAGQAHDYSTNSPTNPPQSRDPLVRGPAPPLPMDLLARGPTPEFYEMFPEEIVKLAIRDAIYKSSGELTKADYNTVITLVFENYLVGGALLKDEGLKEVAKLRNLEKLNLERHNITDTGLKELTELKQLKELNLRRTKVTYSGVTKLQNALPKCKIDHNATK